MKLQPSLIVFGALAVAAYLIIWSAMKFGVTNSAALMSMSIITLESLTSPILSVKNYMLPTSALLLKACVSLAMTSKVATAPFCRLMFDSL